MLVPANRDGKIMRTGYCGGCRYANKEAKPEAETCGNSHNGSSVWTSGHGTQKWYLKINVPCNSDCALGTSLNSCRRCDVGLQFKKKTSKIIQIPGTVSPNRNTLPMSVTVKWVNSRHFCSLLLAANSSVPYYTQCSRSHNLWLPEVCAERGNFTY